MDTLNDLIDSASHIKFYTIDAEDQIQPAPQWSKTSINSDRVIHLNCPSIIILIEKLHLPPSNSQTSHKIKQFCKIIFSNNHQIYWGRVVRGRIGRNLPIEFV